MGRKLGVPNKITSEIKERLSKVIMDAMSSIDIDLMTQNEKLKLIQIGLTYVIPRLKQVENIQEEPRKFEIEIIDSLSKYSDKEIDEAIRS
jgi:hypothetical protein